MVNKIVLPGGAALDFAGRALVMAIVNCTDDSFYAQSRNKTADDALSRALKAAEDGADIIDFGAESTRPGALYLDAQEEIRRLIPVIERFRKKSALPVSVDTRKYEVARLALEAGADIINDISAMEDSPAMGELCASKNAALILMHKKGVPQDMQEKPYYQDVVAEVAHYLQAAAHQAESSGVAPERIILDPGIGFGKRPQDNLDLIAHFDAIVRLGYPSLMALSRKSFIGAVTGREVEDRLAGTLAAQAAALEKGAHIIRAHDVAETLDQIKIFYALRERRKAQP